ncbi:MAG TPA: AI-2E family transporter [Thermodesulfobacteriota bacterium]
MREETSVRPAAPETSPARPSRDASQGSRRYYGEILFAFALVLGSIFVYQTMFLLKPFVLALLIGLALEPPVARLARLGLNRYLAAVLVVVAVAAVVGLLVALVAPIVAEQVVLLAAQGPSLLRQALASLDRLAERFPAVGERLSWQAALEPLLARAGDIFPLLAQLFGTVTRIGIDTILILFLLVFGLGEPEPIGRLIRRAVPGRFGDEWNRVLERIVPQLRAWVVGLAIAIVAVGVMTLVGLVVVGVPYAFAFATIAGVLTIVPFVGPLLSGVLPVLVTIGQDPAKAVAVIVVFVVVQQIESHLLTPYVMARTVDLHPILIAFLALVLTFYLGLFGTFVATPTAALLVTLYREVYLPRAHPGETA